MRGKLLVGVWLALMLVAAACTSGTATNSGTDDNNPPPTQSSGDDPANTNGTAGGSPADGARAFMELFLSGEDASPYVCEIANTQDDFMISPLPSVTGVEVSMDVSGLVYTVTSESGDSAVVNVTGKAVLTMTVQEQDTVQDIDYDSDPLILNMKNENGWKVCT